MKSSTSKFRAANFIESNELWGLGILVGSHYYQENFKNITIASEREYYLSMKKFIATKKDRPEYQVQCSDVKKLSQTLMSLPEQMKSILKKTFDNNGVCKLSRSDSNHRNVCSFKNSKKIDDILKMYAHGLQCENIFICP